MLFVLLFSCYVIGVCYISAQVGRAAWCLLQAAADQQAALQIQQSVTIDRGTSAEREALNVRIRAAMRQARAAARA